MEGKGVRGGGRIGEEDDEEHHWNPFFPSTASNHKLSSPKLQFRKEVSRARWHEEMGMAEIVEQKGSIWATTGVVRNGKLHCYIEEILFLAERGALILTSSDSKTLGLEDIYKKIAGGKLGCSWECFEAYKHLRSLGYIIQRHGSPWTMKVDGNSTSEGNEESSWYLEHGMPMLLKVMQINELKPNFDVYLPNSKFRKSAPGDPSFVLCLCSNRPPSRLDLENLEKLCGDVPLKFCFVDHGRVSFFSCDETFLPTLP